MTMNNELRTRLVELGWDPEQIYWGERLDGSPGHITLRLPDGRQVTEFSPMNTVTGGNQVAIVRFG